MEHIG